MKTTATDLYSLKSKAFTKCIRNFETLDNFVAKIIGTFTWNIARM